MLASPADVEFRRVEPNSPRAFAAMMGLIAGLFVLFIADAYGDWKPPKNPNPDKILTEAL